MNLVEATVIEILGASVHHVQDWGAYWEVKVRANCYGREYETSITTKTEEEIRKVEVGYTWLT